MIPSEFIDQLLERVDIIDVIEQYVPLKKGGQNYMACCPFHKEKTPSFTVSHAKQFYHCFGCGAHGTAIGFMMAYQGSSFVEAVEILATQVGMTLPRQVVSEESAQERKQKQQHKLSLEEVVEKAADFYQAQLKSSTIAIDYLKKRGLSGEIATQYRLGYAPDSFQGLSDCFSSYPDPLLIESGLLIEKDEHHYDRFRGRIMFPIRNQRGQVIGFGGRVLEKGEPKYLNSPETPLFSKGRELYGLYEAKAAIKEAQTILVVEGYMDVVALAQFGIGYAVACLGTATTPDQIKLMLRHSGKVCFCFDGDAAGKRAAWRALENSLPLLKDDISINFLFLPVEHDPDSFIRAYGKEAFERTLQEKSIPLSDYFVDYLCHDLVLDTAEGKAKLVKRCTPLIQQIRAQAFGFLLKQRLARRLEIELHDFELLLGQKSEQKQKKHFKNFQLPKYTVRPTAVSLVERSILNVVFHPQWAKEVLIPEYLMFNQEMACLMTLVEAAKQMKDKVKTALLIEYMRHTEYETLLSEILQKPLLDEQALAEETQEAREAFIDGIKKLMRQLSMEQLDLLKDKDQKTGLSNKEKQLLLSLLIAQNNQQ